MDIFKDNTKTLIVITTETSWYEIPRMRHHVAMQLAKQNNILFVELDSKGRGEIRRISDNIIVWKIGGYFRGVNKFRILKKISYLRQSILIKFKINKINSATKIILNFKYDFYQIYNYRHWKLKYFFLNDDFINMPDVNSLKIKNFRTIDQSKTINYSDRVFVSALALSNQIEEKSKPFTVIHSGHDFHARFNFKKSNSEKKILCFMGFINNNLELDWIELLAKNNKYEIKFIGPVEHNSVKKRLSIYNNIYFEDSRTGINLQNFLNDSDVFIMPYKSIEVNTVSSVPAKLFQYLACGRPIISNILPNLISLPEYFVYQAKTSIDFLNLVELAINEDCEKYNMERINFANENKWEARGQLLQSVIVDDLSKFV